MERVMIGGGSVLNWSFLSAGLVDEVSLVVSPFADVTPSCWCATG
jgi:riboflavin biosynthesis pyrimidine reductase